MTLQEAYLTNKNKKQFEKDLIMAGFNTDECNEGLYVNHIYNAKTNPLDEEMKLEIEYIIDLTHNEISITLLGIYGEINFSKKIPKSWFLCSDYDIERILDKIQDYIDNIVDTFSFSFYNELNDIQI